ncbi:MAG TPA: tetratricopeptide repeat protein [Byssovorax sp.]
MSLLVVGVASACAEPPAPVVAARVEPASAPVAEAPKPPPALPFRLPCGDDDADACKKGCDEHQPEDCVTLASMVLRGANGVAAEPERAAGMLRLACGGGSARGGIRLADALREKLVPGDEDTSLYVEACDLGANQGCVRAGKAYLDGAGVGADPVYAASLFARVCQRGNAEACLALGHLNRKGVGVKQDDARARDYFERACKLGLDEGCIGASKDGSVLAPRE